MFHAARKTVFRQTTLAGRRAYASVSSSSPINPNSVGPYQVFDRDAKRMQKNRSATKLGGEASRTVDYVREEVADRMVERLMVGSIISRTRRVNNRYNNIGHQTQVQDHFRPWIGAWSLF